MFCKTCGTLLRPRDTPYGRWMSCPDGHAQPEINQEKHELQHENQEQAKEIRVHDGKSHLDVYDHICKKCGYDKAELVEIMPAYADEDVTRIMKCGKCGNSEMLDGKMR
jgi:DNA-directed RNA polymerase subunit M/transcription elongation factor TFIIS